MPKILIILTQLLLSLAQLSPTLFHIIPYKCKSNLCISKKSGQVTNMSLRWRTENEKGQILTDFRSFNLLKFHFTLMLPQTERSHNMDLANF